MMLELCRLEFEPIMVCRCQTLHRSPLLWLGNSGLGACNLEHVYINLVYSRRFWSRYNKDYAITQIYKSQSWLLTLLFSCVCSHGYGLFLICQELNYEFSCRGNDRWGSNNNTSVQSNLLFSRQNLKAIITRVIFRILWETLNCYPYEVGHRYFNKPLHHGLLFTKFSCQQHVKNIIILIQGNLFTRQPQQTSHLWHNQLENECCNLACIVQRK